jgi:hypothetical protein
MVNPWVEPFEALTERVDADWAGVWALACTACQALEVVQLTVPGAEDDWVLNLAGHFIVSAFIEVVDAHPEAAHSAETMNPRGLDFGARDGAVAAICLLLNGARRKLLKLAGRTVLDLDDQLCALGMHRYLESAAVTIARTLHSGSAGLH